MRIIALMALTLLLTGCVPSDPVVTPVPVPSATPLFATDADALKAAEDAYAAYENQLDADFATYDTSELAKFASAEALAKAKTAVEKFKSDGQRQSGSTVISKFQPEDMSSLTNARESASPASFYSCLDFTGVNVTDAAGNSVVRSGGRQYSMEVSLVWNAPLRKLLVSSEEVWSGKSVC
ncbi:MAG: hypothetical protein JWN80_2659 [Microbacteriaceae bacterium]|jgi:hypothetical protein|nr:hypothetical protein [Microbacteriaceae bacterium]